MIKGFPIDFIRQLIEQELLKMHKENPNYIGGANEVSLMSFYEQLQKEEEVNRYVEIYRDLVEQQNRTGLIMNGTIISPENPTITNLKTTTIIPLTFTCSFRVKLADRDRALDTINDLIERLKGKSHDIAMYDNGQLFKVGTIGNDIDVSPKVKDGDYLGDISTSGVNDGVAYKLSDFNTKGYSSTNLSWCYARGVQDDIIHTIYKDNGTWKFIEDDGSHPEIIFAPTLTRPHRYCLSTNFESIRCDEPRTLNANEYCVISFGGSATIVQAGTKLGNQLVRVGIKKNKIVASPDITISDTYHYLEPLELPSGNNADTQVSRLLDNKFMTNSHTNAINVSLSYTFVFEFNTLLTQFFKYARYGIQADGTTITYANGISPNMIYDIRETWSSWGSVENIDFKAKIVESIDIENTEGDTLTITLPFQIQGDNN